MHTDDTRRGLSLLGDDSWASIHTRGDYENAVTQLKSSADNLNITASNELGWKSIYDTAINLYNKYHDVGFFASINPFGNQATGDSAWNAIADSQRRVDEFAAQMRANGKGVADPEHKQLDTRLFGGASDSMSSFVKALPWVIGGVVVIGVGAAALPVVLPLITARRVVG